MLQKRVGRRSIVEGCLATFASSARASEVSRRRLSGAPLLAPPSLRTKGHGNETQDPPKRGSFPSSRRDRRRRRTPSQTRRPTSSGRTPHPGEKTRADKGCQSKGQVDGHANMQTGHSVRQTEQSGCARGISCSSQPSSCPSYNAFRAQEESVVRGIAHQDIAGQHRVARCMVRHAKVEVALTESLRDATPAGSGSGSGSGSFPPH